jgi:hypothetical protein
MAHIEYRKLKGNTPGATYTSAENFFESHSRDDFDAFMASHADKVEGTPEYKLASDGSAVMMKVSFVDEASHTSLVDAEASAGKDYPFSFNWERITEDEYNAG